MHKVFYSENYLRAFLQDKKKTDWRQNETLNGIAMVISLALILTNDTFICCQVRGTFYSIILQNFFTKVFVGFYVRFQCMFQCLLA